MIIRSCSEFNRVINQPKSCKNFGPKKAGIQIWDAGVAT